MILPSDVAKKIEEVCNRNNNLEKALAFAIDELKGVGFDHQTLEIILSTIQDIKEGKEV